MPTRNLVPVIEYYSGSQVTVFIGDIWVDDMASYQISLQQNKNPIYGYGSQHYDFVSKGRVIVSGTLTINFKNPNYLWVLLAYKDAKETQTTIDKIEERRRKVSEIQKGEGGPDALLQALKDPLSKDFKGITEIFKNQYWQKSIPELNVIEDEKFNHRPFDLSFYYKGEGIGVIERVEGVELIGKGKQVQIDGQPVAETYNFIARKFV